MDEFFRTGMGRKFFESTMPAIAEGLVSLSKALAASLSTPPHRAQLAATLLAGACLDVREEDVKAHVRDALALADELLKQAAKP